MDIIAARRLLTSRTGARSCIIVVPRERRLWRVIK
jgi:hypothetical protein